MNFLSGVLLSRHGRVNFWAKASCRDVLKSALVLINTKDINCNHTPYKTKTTGEFEISLGAKNLRVLLLSGLNPMDPIWTQVRYSGNCPRLHRDIDFPNFDPYRKDEFKDVRKTDWGAGDQKPGTTYVIGFFGVLCATYSLKTELTHFISYMAPAADVLAMASIEVDISKIMPGACASHKWRGKPLFIKNRTPADIDLESKTPVETLRDPQSPEQRTIKQEWLVVIGICTHLGCVPIPNSGDWAGGFYCPCHGSHYDNVGRIRKGPAPLNLEVPPHKFISDSVILVG